LTGLVALVGCGGSAGGGTATLSLTVDGSPESQSFGIYCWTIQQSATGTSTEARYSGYGQSDCAVGQGDSPTGQPVATVVDAPGAAIKCRYAPPAGVSAPAVDFQLGESGEILSGDVSSYPNCAGLAAAAGRDAAAIASQKGDAGPSFTLAGSNVDVATIQNLCAAIQQLCRVDICGARGESAYGVLSQAVASGCPATLINFLPQVLAPYYQNRCPSGGYQSTYLGCFGGTTGTTTTYPGTTTTTNPTVVPGTTVSTTGPWGSVYIPSSGGTTYPGTTTPGTTYPGTTSPGGSYPNFADILTQLYPGLVPGGGTTAGSTGAPTGLWPTWSVSQPVYNPGTTQRVGQQPWILPSFCSINPAQTSQIICQFTQGPNGSWIGATPSGTGTTTGGGYPNDTLWNWGRQQIYPGGIVTNPGSGGGGQLCLARSVTGECLYYFNPGSISTGGTYVPGTNPIFTTGSGTGFTTYPGIGNGGRQQIYQIPPYFTGGGSYPGTGTITTGTSNNVFGSGGLTIPGFTGGVPTTGTAAGILPVNNGVPASGTAYAFTTACVATGGAGFSTVSCQNPNPEDCLCPPGYTPIRTQ
jgi:hypothetical protein